MTKAAMKTHLIGVGDHDSIPLRQVQPGMTRVYNYGITAEVVSVEFSSSGKQIRETVKEENGKIYTSRWRNPSTFVAVKLCDSADGADKVPG